jgi:8-oxo-dGTP diphosphatase
MRCNPVKFSTLCYVRSQEHTLLIYRNKKPNDMHAGKWNGVGGKLEPGETPEECARREIMEESGLKVSDLVWKGLITFPQFSKQEDWYTFIYLAEAADRDVIDLPEGELHWIANDELLSLNLWAGDRIFLHWLDKPGFFSAKFIYQEGELLDYQVIFYP